MADPLKIPIDPNGNLTIKTEGSDTWGYEWNAEDQLTRVTKNSVEQARFAYDPRGRRVEKVAGGVTTSYTYDGSNVLREVRGSTTLKYVHGPGVDEPLATDDGTALSYYHADGLGSIVKTTNAAGAAVLTRQYDTWGNIEVGASEPGYAFTGREWGPETGLYYYRARYYDPKQGRFVSEDPIQWAGGNNFYAYVENNPVLAGDPSGLSAYLHCEVIPSTRGGGLVGGAVLALTQARHCYIEIICPGKYHTTIELYGPSPGAPNGTPMMNLPNPARNANATTTPIYPPGCGKDPTKYDPCPSQDCRFEDELLNQFNLNQPPPTYNPQGPNSNTFAARIIRGAGGRTVFPPSAFGCNY